MPQCRASGRWRAAQRGYCTVIRRQLFGTLKFISLRAMTARIFIAALACTFSLPAYATEFVVPDASVKSAKNKADLEVVARKLERQANKCDGGGRRPECLNVYVSLVKVAFALYNTEMALTYSDKAISVLDKTSLSGNAEYRARLMLSHANALRINGINDKSYEISMGALSVLEKENIRGEAYFRVCTSLIAEGAIKGNRKKDLNSIEINQSDQSVKIAERCLSVLRSPRDNINNSYVSLLSAVAYLHINRADYKIDNHGYLKAEPILRRAKAIFEKNNLQRNENVISNLSIVIIENKGEFSEAESLRLEAFEIDKSRNQDSVAYGSMVDFYARANRPREELKYLDRYIWIGYIFSKGINNYNYRDKSIGKVDYILYKRKISLLWMVSNH